MGKAAALPYRFFSVPLRLRGEKFLLNLNPHRAMVAAGNFGEDEGTLESRTQRAHKRLLNDKLHGGGARG